ncbi:hypothetical protein RclHR1_01590012 [Rhizophagus clarus]|uniref:Interferon alpha-inducible protein 27-like protein 1 n=1 Tax=Rhizophagus clarus TaxID=94130 RepID=A0A2Z6QGD8_9GLOM|nr:hypothetical protein RclHR1_01590012 [Rhizophagus clarus]GES87208.1 interferon alpha-inducible protein 27-like protein 1 [Rhizophagus clarus]
MTLLVSDEKLFEIVLYSAFVNNEFLTSIRDIWKNPWVTGTSGAIAIGLIGAIIAPIIVSAIIYALGFGTGGIAAGSFASWYMSLHNGMIVRGSLLSILQSIGASGLGSLGISISSSFGAAIGILIGVIGGSKLGKFIEEMELNGTEKQMLESFVQIEENVYHNNNIIIFTLMPALLYNDKILKCFFETFITSSPFANSKLFRFDFIENNFLKLKSEEKRVNYTVYNLLIDDYEKSRIDYIFQHDYFLTGYKLNLSGYKPSNPMIYTLVEIWNVINGNVVMDTDFTKFRNQIKDQIDKIDINKFHKQINDHINKIDINKFRDQINKVGNKFHDQIKEQINKIDINKFRDQINDQVNKIDINKFSNQINDQVSYFSDLFHDKLKSK